MENIKRMIGMKKPDLAIKVVAHTFSHISDPEPAIEIEYGAGSISFIRPEVVTRQLWRFEGKPHRLTGPAIIDSQYDKVISRKWFLFGFEFSEHDFDRMLLIYRVDPENPVAETLSHMKGVIERSNS